MGGCPFCAGAQGGVEVLRVSWAAREKLSPKVFGKDPGLPRKPLGPGFSFGTSLS